MSIIIIHCRRYPPPPVWGVFFENITDFNYHQLDGRCNKCRLSLLGDEITGNLERKWWTHFFIIFFSSNDQMFHFDRCSRCSYGWIVVFILCSSSRGHQWHALLIRRQKLLVCLLATYNKYQFINNSWIQRRNFSPLINLSNYLFIYSVSI